MKPTPYRFRIIRMVDGHASTRRVTGVRLHRLFAAQKDKWHTDYNLTHLPTGYTAARHVPTLRLARQIVSKLLRLYPEPLWRFKDPAAYKNRPDCGPMIRTLGAATRD